MAQRFGAGIVNHSGPVEERPIIDGYVSRIKPAPKAFSDPLWVVIPGYGTEAAYKCAWSAEHGATLPEQGAAVQVAIGDGEIPRVIWWEGQTNGVSGTVHIPKKTAEGSEGELTVVSGIITNIANPT